MNWVVILSQPRLRSCARLLNFPTTAILDAIEVFERLLRLWRLCKRIPLIINLQFNLFSTKIKFEHFHRYSWRNCPIIHCIADFIMRVIYYIIYISQFEFILFSMSATRRGWLKAPWNLSMINIPLIYFETT